MPDGWEDLRNVGPAGVPRKSSGQWGRQNGLSEGVGTCFSDGHSVGEGSGKFPVGGASGLEVGGSTAALSAEHLLCSVNKQERNPASGHLPSDQKTWAVHKGTNDYK